MADEILKTRLKELSRTLAKASLTTLCCQKGEVYDEERSWITVGLSLPSLEGQVINVTKSGWTFLESQFKQDSELINLEIARLQEKVEKLSPAGDEKEELRGLWDEYTELESRAEKLVGEIVELLGGLAFRDRSVDPWFFETADQLLGWYTHRTDDTYDALTVPSVRSTVARTLIRIVGLRFPEWSVWALPLTAYEFAYQYLKLGLKPPKVRAMMEAYLRGGDIKDLSDQEVLLADVFATFIMGPAYAFAALGLRFTPQDAERALVIFRVLEHHDESGTYDQDFLRNLRKRWESSPASGDPRNAERVEKLERFADAALKALDNSYLPATRYSATQDWGKAKVISRCWKEDGKVEGKSLRVEKEPRVSLFDALNAAWLSRFKAIADEDRLEKAARRLCSGIIEMQRKARTGSQPQAALHVQTGVRA